MDVLDLKGLYRGTPVDVETDPELYRAVAEAFPDAYLEDPDLNDETRPVLEPHADRITWDAPLHSLADIEALERQPRAINSKPSRFGSLQELFGVYEHCRAPGDRGLRRRPGRGRAGTRPDPVPGLALSPRHPQRRRPLRLQRPGRARRPALQPARPGALGDRVSLGRVGGPLGRRPFDGCAVSLRRNQTRRSDAREALRRRAQRADRQRVRRPPAVHRRRRLLRRQRPCPGWPPSSTARRSRSATTR